MSGKSEKFFDAITHLHEDLIEEAQNYKFRKKTSGWKTFGSLAACIMLIMSIGILTILPRGCGSAGSSGGGADSSSSANAPADNAAPQDAPSTDTAPPPYGDVSGSASGEPGGPPAEVPEGAAPPAGAEHYQFTAIVIEVQDEAILAEPIEYDSHQQVLIPFTNAEFPALAEGDWITVTVEGGLVLTTDPPMVLGVQSIEKIDPAGYPAG